MASLKRQARKAELYNKFKARIRTLDVLLAFVYHADSTKKISESETLLKKLNDADLEHSAELKKIDAAVEEHHDRIIRLRRRIHATPSSSTR